MGEIDPASIVAMVDAVTPSTARAVEAIQRYGLAALLDGTSRTVSEIVSLSGLAPGDIEGGIDALVAAGRIDLDGQRVAGIGGLTLTATAHSLRLPNADMYTWCALDAVGIPAALGLTATVVTRCPQCEEPITVAVHGGDAVAAGPVTLFCPTGECVNVRNDFCSTANLFCRPSHLSQWRADHPSVIGEALGLVDTLELGQAMWGHCRRIQDEPPVEG